MKVKSVSSIAILLIFGALLLGACAPTTQQAKTGNSAAAENSAAEKAADDAAAKEAAARAAATPFISSISPTKGRQGSKITINGERFGNSPTVRFDTTAAKILSASETRIVVLVPTGIAIGKHTVTVEARGYTSNGVEYIDP